MADVNSNDHRTDKVDKSCQTEDTCDEMVQLKVENIILRNRLAKCKKQNAATQQKQLFSFNDVRRDDEQFKFYSGLTWLQFMALWNFLGPSKEKLAYYKSTLKPEKSSVKWPGVKRKLDPINELFLTLMGLRTGLLHRDLAYTFGISASLVAKVVTTWIQYMYLEFSRLKEPMFATREIVARNLPSCFKKFKGIRTIIDCTELFVQQASNFEQQGKSRVDIIQNSWDI